MHAKCHVGSALVGLIPVFIALPVVLLASLFLPPGPPLPHWVLSVWRVVAVIGTPVALYLMNYLRRHSYAQCRLAQVVKAINEEKDAAHDGP